MPSTKSSSHTSKDGSSNTADESPVPFTAFSSFVDSRLLRSLAAQGFVDSTPVQSAVFPLAITESRDILARAATGSGKTLAYGIPLVQKILNARKRLGDGASDPDWLGTRALVLVPTRELAEQVTSHLKTLTQFLNDLDAVRIVNIAASSGSGSGKGKSSADKVQKMQLADKPDVVVATPSRALTHLRSKALDLSHLECLIIDEADLILSYGHSSEDIAALLSGGGGATSSSDKSWSLPSVYQSFLMSATLTSEVSELSSLVLRNPARISVAASSSSSSSSTQANLTQYIVRTSEDDKFLLVYVILKLKLVKGKILIFVNDTDRSYRLKLFLEKFGIRSGVLNAELPFNSRYHAVQEFNRGVFQYLIATDESGLQGVERDSDDEADEEDGERGPPTIFIGYGTGQLILYSASGNGTVISTQLDGEAASGETAEGEAGSSTPSLKRKAGDSKKSNKKRRGGGGAASEYGVTRGIDFVDVACVVNFDLPTSSRSYTHRVGRTARAGRTGMALSLVVPRAQWGPGNQPNKGGKFDTSLKSAKHDEKVWRRIEKDQGKEAVKEYRFDMKQVEGFRYRMEDALRSVTRAYVREARIKELKHEVLNSDKLKAHFEDNPRDLEFLKHDKPLHPARVQSHMKHVPSYLMPRIAPVGGASASAGTTSADTADGTAGGPSAGQTKSGYVPFNKNKNRNGKGGREKGKGKAARSGSGAKKTGGGRRGDPLKSFKRK